MAKKDLHTAKIVEKRVFKLKDLPPITARLDTGYSKAETIKLIETMYKNSNVNVHEANWVIVVIEQVPNKSEKIAIKGEINFSMNWNQKLTCKCYTTIRLDTPKYQLGAYYLVTLGK